MIETMITTGVVLLSIIMTFFHQPLNIQISSQITILAAIDIVDKPDKIKSNNKKSTPINVDTLHKKKLAIEPKSLKQKIKISGYQDGTFVYGEVKPFENDNVQGFIYHPDNSKTYVYGKKVKDTLNLYDSNGNLYQMIHKGPIEHWNVKELFL